ncbi:progestin and adipoQ receptor family member 3-like isoform X2 [Macrobrachium rosenbergii]|uniref:progestin and adipoQ receptor family member 3-like isoform X2 n=1 Tax=Macrobrachium rosenbergii TaxID=79674 RepID=UPI0034D49841
MCQRKKKQNGFILPFHRAPSYLRTNPYIMKGYRVNLSTSQCFRSVLWWTNETLNIWSHIAGFLVFLGLFIYDVTVVYHKYHGTEDDAVVASFVLICFMFFTHRIMYMCLVFVLFAGAMVMLLTPKFMGAEWEWARVALFTGWAASGVLPTLHWLYLYYGADSNIVSVFLPRIMMMYIISGSAAFVYVFKIPERYFPGRFDYIGASHQLWHLIIVVALVYWHQTGLEYARFRMTFGCNAESVTG